MPKDKDLKRDVRARMRETGERYTDARSALAPATAELASTSGRRPMGARQLVIDDVGPGFVAVADGPVSRFYEFPRYPDVGLNWSSGFEAAQRLFVSRGLLGGWFRTWVKDESTSEKATVAIHALEFESRSAPTEHVESMDDRSPATRLRVVADTPVAAFVGPAVDGFAEAWAWIAAPSLEACVVATGPAEAVERRLRRLAHAQAVVLREAAR